MGVTVVAVLGGSGAFPSAAEEPAGDGAITTTASTTRTPADERRAEAPPANTPTEVPEVEGPVSTPAERQAATEMLPADTGNGRRVVFSEGQQRVWLVAGDDRVLRTYLVSGSVTDNLHPGTYSVYSRSANAIGIDDSGTMKWFVRFTQGDTGAAFGFHDIPVSDGERVQTVAQLGTPTSHGCIRQRPADAKAMWDFAQNGTTVVVVP
jgi:lipoprotein-anchoring transpeptidase ErfK/SrfK